MQLKDLFEKINTGNKIMLSTKDGEFFPSFAELFDYKDYFVKSISIYDKGIFLVEISD